MILEKSKKTREKGERKCNILSELNFNVRYNEKIGRNKYIKGGFFFLFFFFARLACYGRPCELLFANVLFVIYSQFQRQSKEHTRGIARGR